MKRYIELIKNTFILFIGKFSTQFISFLLLPLYTTYLTTSDYGLVDLVITYITLFVPIITIQQEMAVFRYLIDCRDDKQNIKKVINTSLHSINKLSIIFSILYLIIIPFIDIKFKYLILLNIIVTIYSNMLLQIARGLGKNTHYAISSFLTGIITLVSNILLIAVFNLGPKGMLISLALANFINIIYLVLALKLYKYISLKIKEKKLQKEMLKYSLPLVPNSISWWVINASDRTIISLVLGVAANGIYAIANKFGSIVSFFLSIFNMSWTESASLYIDDKDRDKYFSNIINATLTIISSLCLGIITCMPFIFPILIKETFKEAYLYIPILMIGALGNCLVSTYSAIYIAKKMTKQVAVTSLIAAIINIVINIVFIKYIGLYAASISTAIAYLSMAIYRHFDIRKYVKIKYQKNNLIGIISMFIISMILYYQNNFYLNIINLILVIIYVLIVNKKFILILKNQFENKLKGSVKNV